MGWGKARLYVAAEANGRARRLRIPVSGLAKTTRFLASERTAGVFCATREDDYTNTLGQSAVACGCSSCASGELQPARPAEQPAGLWQKIPS